jgi:hypothetical protein
MKRQRICRPISLGGLGVPDLERTGMALRLQWLWFSCTDTSRAWHGLDLQFSEEEKSLFFASTTMTVGDGTQHSSGRTAGLQGLRPRRSRHFYTAASRSAEGCAPRSPKVCTQTDGQGTSKGCLAFTRSGNTSSSGMLSSTPHSRMSRTSCNGAGPQAAIIPPSPAI